MCPDPIGEFHAMICDCGDVFVQHCHCPCDSCNYKPVSRKTAYRHALECKNGQRLFAVLSRPQSPQQQIDEQEQFSQENEEGDGNGQNVSYCKALIDLLQLKGLHNMSIKCIEVIVPIHLKVHDMVMIMGDNDQQWFGQVGDCNCVDQERSIRVAFYIQSRRRQECYERESRHVDKVSRRSIIGLAKGTWTNNGKEWIPDSAWQ